ncbi:hypothetical protein OROMI_009291 [Orobanche minor]
MHIRAHRGHHTKFAHAIALPWMKPFDLVLQMMEGAFQSCSRQLDDSRWKASICTLFGRFARGIAKSDFATRSQEGVDNDSTFNTEDVSLPPSNGVVQALVFITSGLKMMFIII